MKRENDLRRWLWEYAIITAGCAIYAVTFNIFYQPNAISMGGFTGVGQIINYFLPRLPVGVITFVLNVPLMVVGVRKLGLKLLMGTLYAIAMGSVFIDGMSMLCAFPTMDPLLAALYGGALVGVSMGFLMKVGATTGGTELLARLLKFKLQHLSIGKLCLTIDVVVITLYAITFRSINNALYGIISMYVASLAMDTIVYGSTNAKLAYIISDHSAEIAQWFLDRDMGVTLLDGRGAYTGNEKNVLLCAFKKSQIIPIKSAVTAIDPSAFIIVCEAKEVLGEGFGEFSPDSL